MNYTHYNKIKNTQTLCKNGCIKCEKKYLYSIRTKSYKIKDVCASNASD